MTSLTINTRRTEIDKLKELCLRCGRNLNFCRQYDHRKFTRAYVDCPCGFTQRRPRKLDRKLVFEPEPCKSYMMHPREGKTISNMIDSGFFVTNPNSVGTGAPASMYFDSDELGEYMKKHPDAKIWTVVEAENNLYVMEGSHVVNRIATMIETPGKRLEMKALRLVRRYKPKIKLLSKAEKRRRSK